MTTSIGADAPAVTALTPVAGHPALPLKRPGLFAVTLILTAAAIYFAFLTPSIVSLSIRIFGVDPTGKALGLSTVILIGALISVVMLPLFGSLSDRTRGRFGRRRPWLVGGSLTVLAGAIVVGTASDVAIVATGWAISQLGFSAVIAAFLALVPDFIPERLRARTSAGIGVVTGLVVLGGIAFASANVANPVTMMVAPAAVAVLFVLGLSMVIAKADVIPADAAALPRYSVREFAGSFFINPWHHPSFAWNWISRLLFGIAMVGLQTYSTYFLTDVTGLSLQDATARYTFVTLITTPIGFVFTVAAGFLSDKMNRRKIFVVGAAVIAAAGILIAALLQSADGFLVAYIVFSIGLAFYLTVDVAIAASVVPDSAQTAKAMAVYQVSTTAPAIVVPLLGVLVLTSAAAYVPFFCILGGIALLSAVTILFVKVR
ncbi:MFS transporter [Arthrobacter sp. TE12232]